MFWNDDDLDGPLAIAGEGEEDAPWFFDVPDGEIPAASLSAAVGAGGQTMQGQVLTTDDIVTFARTTLKFDLEDNQIPLLESWPKRVLVNCSRQWGKSTLTAIKVIYLALTRPGCFVLVAGPAERQSAEFLAKVAALMRRGFPDWKLPRDGFNKVSMLFPNGSRVVGLPGTEKTVRSFSAVSMLVIEESAGVPDALYHALRPMLAVGNGDLWVLGTPKGRQGFFFEEWEFGGERWTRFQVTAAECAPRISKEFLEDEVAALGAAVVQQEYFGKFIEDGGMLYDRAVVERAMTDEWGAFEFGSTGTPVVGGRSLFLGLDLGKLRDYTAVALVERCSSGELVVRYVERAALGTPYTQVVKRMEELTRHRALAGACHLTVDATGVGQPVVELLQRAGLQVVVPTNSFSCERKQALQTRLAQNVPDRVEN